jgi:hypothetical protein
MKNFKRSKIMLALTIVVLTIVSLTYTSCSKQENMGQSSKKTLTAAQTQRILDAINSIPEIRVKAGKYGFKLPTSVKDGGFSFSDPSNGYEFSSSSNVEFVTSPEGNVMLVSTDGACSNAGGMVVAGSSSLDINMAICVSAASQGNEFFDFGTMDSTFGFSMVLGIAGDFEALMNDEIDPNADITDYIYGFAMYIVYKDQASGSYEVIDFTDPNGLTDFDSKAVSLVFDFRDGKMYISKDGNLTVGSNTISFNGNYFELDWFADSSATNDDQTPAEVSGYGTMGCM